jgi:TonB-linked SusC/RagA family outer membrane protein
MLMGRVLLSALLLLVGYSAMAQTRQLTGVVRDTKSNTGILSATVKVRGQATSTATDVNGNFSLSVPAGKITLEVSSIGFAAKTVDVEANENNITISLSEDVQALSEVVVSAFGMSKQKKALPYSVTQLSGDQFTQSRTPNIGNALTGKVAGVNVSVPATGAGGSTRVLIRGGSSLAGNDQPLYVINGIPMESSNLGSAGLWGGNDAGDGLSFINPDDIENISVLKGNTAAALYGARAANGVILITTKSGKARKGMGVSVNSNITIDRAIDRTDFQTEYGPGIDGAKPTNQNAALDAGQSHWGPKLDGSQVIQFDGVSRPYSNTGENINDFYRTGVTLNHSVALNGGNESGNYRFSVSDLHNSDIMPNATFTRQSVNFSINSKLKNLTLSTSGQYTKQKAKNRPRLSDSPGNGNFTVVMKPNTLPFDVMKGTTDKYGALPNGNELRFQSNVFQTNPYWAAYQFFRSDNTDRFVGNISLRYDLKKWLYVQGRFGTDFQNRDDASYTPYGTAYSPTGDFFENFQNTRQDNYDLFIGGDHNFGDFGVDILLGASKTRSRFELKGGGGSNLVVPFVHSVRNVASPSFSYAFSQQGINSLFGSANISYKKYLFLNLTGRQDEFSTLAPDKNSLFYPSAGISAILSDAFKLPAAISFAKVRASWAQVGGGAPSAYGLLVTYGLVGAGHLGANLAQINNGSIPNAGLQPYTSTETEIGADIRFLKNRFGIDIAWYSRKTTDDILPASISATSGFGSTFVNVGELTNKGIEILLNAAIIDKKNLRWDLSVNFAHNKSEAVNLGTDAAGNLTKNFPGEESRVRRERISDVLGMPLGMITGYKHKTNAKGEKLYTPEGYPIATAGYEPIAEGRHPNSAGINSSLRYKNFTFDFLIDIRQGGHLVSGTNYFAYTYGLQKETLKGRDGSLQIQGTLETGNPLNVTIPVANLDNYYSRYAQITENLVYDASFGRLRQASIGYNVPSKLLSKTPFESLSISLVGRNLALLWSKVPNVDPESAYSVTTTSQGLEFFAVPQPRSFGVNIAVNF